MEWNRFGNAFVAIGEDQTIYVVTWYSNAWAPFYMKVSETQSTRISTGSPTPDIAKLAVDQFIAEQEL